jgi:hypothetical protein
MSAVEAGPVIVHNCGDVTGVIWWEITKANLNAKGGAIIQDLAITWAVTDCQANPKSAKGNPENLSTPLHYWEAWLAPMGSPGRSKDFADRFRWVDEGSDTKGEVSWSGSPAFYHGVQEGDLIKAGWKRYNPATMAADLYSTTTSPNFGDGSKPRMSHQMKIKWNCCCNTKSKRTQLVSKELKSEETPKSSSAIPTTSAL